jgi:hypothetical protein
LMGAMYSMHVPSKVPVTIEDFPSRVILEISGSTLPRELSHCEGLMVVPRQSVLAEM